MQKIEGTILISDKNKGLLTALVLLLQKYFSRVMTEEDPEKILELAASSEVDIVILDAGQNGRNGEYECLELVRKITALEQNVQVVALTNFGQSKYAMELADQGAFDFISKPWNNEKLLITLRNAYQMKQYADSLKKLSVFDDCQEEKQECLEEEKNTVKKGVQWSFEKVMTLEQMEKKLMKSAIKRNRGNISLAAEELGITRQTLYNKGKKYKLFD